MVNEFGLQRHVFAFKIMLDPWQLSALGGQGLHLTAKFFEFSLNEYPLSQVEQVLLVAE
jgi:hypothetical protein